MKNKNAAKLQSAILFWHAQQLAFLVSYSGI